MLGQHGRLCGASSRPISEAYEHARPKSQLDEVVTPSSKFLVIIAINRRYEGKYREIKDKCPHPQPHQIWSWVTPGRPMPYSPKKRRSGKTASCLIVSSSDEILEEYSEKKAMHGPKKGEQLCMSKRAPHFKIMTDLPQVIVKKGNTREVAPYLRGQR